MAKVRLTLSVSDSHLKHLDKVAKAAQKAGMTVEHRHDDLGVLTGSIDAKKIDKLHRIAGVAQIAEDRELRIAPPGNPVQ
jgi:hypothetical protein